MASEEASVLLGWLEEELRNGNFEKVDDYLKTITVSDLGEVAILCAVTITFHGKERLPSRQMFLEQAESVLKSRLGEERAEKLLKNRR